MPSGVLFDVDGTLVDTTYLHAVCWAEAMRQHGHVVVMADVHHTIGMSGDKLLERLLDGIGDDESAEIDAAHSTLYKQFWGRLNPLPGASELLRACAARGLDVVLASSAAEEELAALRSVLDVDDVITAATSSSDAEEGKPAPDIVHTALDRAGLRAEDVVFVGDAVWDGRAARHSGVAFIAVTCGGTPEAELREAGAIEVWRDPADLLAHLDESALGRE